MTLHPNAKLTPTQRGLIAERVLRQGWAVAKAAAAVGVSARTAYKWLARYRQEGSAGLADRSSAPHRSPRRTPARKVRRIEQLRRQRWAAWRIARKLRLARSTVSGILRRLGLGKLRALDPKPLVRRYERQRPGELLHVDTKKLGRFRHAGHRAHGNRARRSRHVGWEYAHVCIDDASRVAYVELLPSERAEDAVPFLERAVAWFERRGIHVERVMTDNGSAYRSTRHREACQALGVRHLKTRPYSPKTNGKAERFIQTLQREWAYSRSYASSAMRRRTLAPWLRYYNRKRPHWGLNGQAPITRLEAAR